MEVWQENPLVDSSAVAQDVEAHEQMVSAAQTAAERTPLLLHACCGPCSLEPILALRDEGYEPHVLWTNPNIQPVEEHDHRHDTLAAWLTNPLVNIELIEGACDRDTWERVAAPHGFDRVPRCRACYALRIAETCRVAKERGFTHVSTTLAVSPYQLFEDCTQILERIAQDNGLVPVIQDWRERYPEATRRSRAMGMYRQNYCGCRFSAVEAQKEREERKAARKAKREAEKAAKRAAREAAEAAAEAAAQVEAQAAGEASSND